MFARRCGHCRLANGDGDRLDLQEFLKADAAAFFAHAADAEAAERAVNGHVRRSVHQYLASVELGTAY